MSYVLSFLFFCCSAVCWLHVKKIIADKTVKGVSLVPTFVFMTTNLFEMYYFGSIHDWWNVAGALSMFGSNIAWTACVFYYMNKERRLTLSFDDPVLAQLHLSA